MKLLGYDQLLYFFNGLKNLFVAKETGKGLSSNDYTTNEKNKLAAIENGATKVIVDDGLSSVSNNAVQNKVVKNALDLKANTNHGIHVNAGGTAGQVYKKTSNGYEWVNDYSHPSSHPATMITDDSTHRFVTDVEKSNWNGKANSSHNHSISDINNLQNTLNGKVNTSSLGQANGVATLGADGKVPSTQLPSYVDDVIEGYLYNGKFYQEQSYNTLIAGESSKIYVDIGTNKSYRYSGSIYIKIESVDIQLITNSEIDTILNS